ncbi:hypothetical protein XENTR_v10016031 [Xenopus tropicalis]|nr:hypothetical protein XENTR_v10016031 [Xenopus tropicalis]
MVSVQLLYHYVLLHSLLLLLTLPNCYFLLHVYVKLLITHHKNVQEQGRFLTLRYNINIFFLDGCFFFFFKFIFMPFPLCLLCLYQV